jgi:hypothetical protein
MAGTLKIGGATEPVGAREDLSNLIRTADVAETPFFAMAKKTAGPKNVLFQWQMDKYNAVDRSSVADGQDVDLTANSDVFTAANTRALAKNYVHVSQRSTRIGFYTDDVQNVAGAPSEFDRSMARRTFELRRDMESVLTSNQNGSYASNTAKTKALGSFICENGYANGDIGGADANPSDTATNVDANFKLSEGTGSSNAVQTTVTLTEQEVQDLMEAIYSQTGTSGNFDGIIGVTLKGKFSKLAGTHTATAGATTMNRDQNDSSLISTIDVYVGDFGRVRLHPSTFVDGDLGSSKGKEGGYFLNMNGLEIKYHTPPTATKLTTDGGGPAGLVRSIYGLCVYNPLEHGRFRTATA